ncbi:MAG: hypothetical protein ACREXY_21110 [Gammaproteobacteria bacterium]
MPHNANVGDELRYRVRVTDSSRLDPFENFFTLHIRPSGSPPQKGKPGSPKKPAADEKGAERERPSSLAMPPITPVREPEWPKYAFTKLTALKVKLAGSFDADGTDASTTTYDFFVNVDHQSLRAEQKRSKTLPKVLETRFTYAIVLIGLALLQEDKAKRPVSSGDSDEEANTAATNVEKEVEHFTMAVAPIILPMLELLPDLTDVEEPPTT